jgi:hypothetical protein
MFGARASYATPTCAPSEGTQQWTKEATGQVFFLHMSDTFTRVDNNNNNNNNNDTIMVIIINPTGCVVSLHIVPCQPSSIVANVTDASETSTYFTHDLPSNPRAHNVPYLHDGPHGPQQSHTLTGEVFHERLSYHP